MGEELKEQVRRRYAGVALAAQGWARTAKPLVAGLLLAAGPTRRRSRWTLPGELFGGGAGRVAGER